MDSALQSRANTCIFLLLHPCIPATNRQSALHSTLFSYFVATAVVTHHQHRRGCRATRYNVSSIVTGTVYRSVLQKACLVNVSSTSVQIREDGGTSYDVSPDVRSRRSFELAL